MACRDKNAGSKGITFPVGDDLVRGGSPADGVQARPSSLHGLKLGLHSLHIQHCRPLAAVTTGLALSTSLVNQPCQCTLKSH